MLLLYIVYVCMYVCDKVGSSQVYVQSMSIFLFFLLCVALLCFARIG